MHRILVTAAVALLAATGTARADSNLLLNGSFDQPGPNFVAGSYCYLGYAPLECGSLPGWSGAMEHGELWRHGVRRDALIAGGFFRNLRITLDWRARVLVIED